MQDLSYTQKLDLNIKVLDSAAGEKKIGEVPLFAKNIGYLFDFD